jgi:hypothetical protein
MKILFITLGVLLAAFVIIQIFAIRGQSNIETYPYAINKKYDTFEIRKYEATLFTSVKLSTSEYKDASSKGFSILAGYIFGKNESNEKMSMTSPVTMSLEDSITMMFMVPKGFTKETLPQPDQSQIKFIEEPEKTVAAINFGGWADDEKIEKYKKILKSALDAEGIAYTDQFFFFGYNPPYQFFNRKNEVIVELKTKD